MSPSTVINMSLPPARNGMNPFSLEDFSFPFDPTIFFLSEAEETGGAGPSGALARI